MRGCERDRSDGIGIDVFCGSLYCEDGGIEMKEFDVIRKLLDDMEAEMEQAERRRQYDQTVQKWADENGKSPYDYWQYHSDYQRPSRPFVVRRLGITVRALIKQLYD